jgi:hypothetical protein
MTVLAAIRSREIVGIMGQNECRRRRTNQKPEVKSYSNNFRMHGVMVANREVMA